MKICTIWLHYTDLLQKIIWFRTGNLTNDEVAKLLIRYKSNIDQFVHDEFSKNDGCLAIYLNGTANL